MRLLLDTQLLIWIAEGSPRLRPRTREAVAGAEARVFSVASLWETAIKHAQGKPDFPFDAVRLRDGLLRSGYAELAVMGPHALAVADLPAIHGDPFDRLLLAQARVEGLTLLTADKRLALYGAPVRLA